MGTSNDARGSVKKLDTQKMADAAVNLKTQVEKFQDSRNRIDQINTELLSTWIGKSRNSYEIQYALLKRNLKDIEDALYDFYDGIVESEGSYMEADEKVAKAIVDKV